MPPIRAPSPAALRTLRSLTFPSASTNTTRHPCLNRITVTTHSNPHFNAPHRSLSTSNTARNRYAPRTHERGPTSEEDTQTDFNKMDIFSNSNVAAPATSIDACTTDGFHLNNNVKITNHDGVLLVGGEAFIWSPHKPPSPSTSSSTSSSSSSYSPFNNTSSPKLLTSPHNTLSLPASSLHLLSILSPKPDLLLLGTGSKLWMLSAQTRSYINTELGIRVDVMDTANASSAYNLLAQERGVDGGSSVGAALLPIGWKGR